MIQDMRSTSAVMIAQDRITAIAVMIAQDRITATAVMIAQHSYVPIPMDFLTLMHPLARLGFVIHVTKVEA